MILRIFFILIFATSAASAKLPDIVVIVEDRLQTPSLRELLRKTSTPRAAGDFRVALDPSCRQAAMLLGKNHLLCGVVSAKDWRRYPVGGETIGKAMQAYGYQSAYIGESHFPLTGFSKDSSWAGNAEDSILMPFDHPVKMPNLAAKLLPDPSKPRLWWFALGSSFSTEALAKHLAGLPNDSIFLHLHFNEGVSPYHRAAQWTLYSEKKLPEHGFDKVRVDWQIHHAVLTLAGGKMPPEPQEYFFHSSQWPAGESLEKHRHKGSLVVSGHFALLDGMKLYRSYPHLTPNLDKEEDIVARHKTHTSLLQAHTQWWQQARLALRDPRAHLVGKDGRVFLTASDWRPARSLSFTKKPPAYQVLEGRRYLLDFLHAIASNEDYRNGVPAWFGSWPLRIEQSGRYRLSARMMPFANLTAEQKKLAILKPGTAHFKLGDSTAETRIHPGSDTIVIETDADAGLRHFEVWFTGQLALERELGAFFVSIERIGEKKYQLKPKP